MKKKILAGSTAACLTATVAVAAFATSNSTYNKDYNIANVMGDYQYFVENNLELGDNVHTVGAMAVGGDATITNFGDGAIEYSYFNNLLQAENYAKGQWLTNLDPTYDVPKVAYYKTTTVAAEQLKGMYEQHADYIDFDKAFSEIRAESKNLANSATKTVTASEITSPGQNDPNAWNANFKVITLNCTEAKNFEIPYEVYKEINRVDFTGIDTIQELATGGYTVSVTGVEDVSIKAVTGYTTKFVNFSLNGGFDLNSGRLDQGFKELEGSLQNGQINISDPVNLTFNFPDATGTVTLDSMPGYVVAPNARVNVEGGNFEGGIIAKSVYNEKAEGHFFAYNAHKGSVETDSSEVDSSSLEDSSTLSDDSSSVAENSSVADSSSEVDSSSVADSSSEVESSSVADSSSEVESSSVADSSSKVESSSVADSSSEAESSSVADSSSEVDSSSVADSSSEVDSSSVADSSSEVDSSSVADSSSEVENSSVADSSSEAESSSVADSSSEAESSSIADSSSELDSSSVADSSSKNGGIGGINNSDSDSSSKGSGSSTSSKGSKTGDKNPSTGATSAVVAGLLVAASAMAVVKKRNND